MKFRNLHITNAQREACLDAYYRGIPDPYFESGIFTTLSEFASRNPGYSIYQGGMSNGYFTLSFSSRAESADPYDLAEMEPRDFHALFNTVWDFDKSCNKAIHQFVTWAVEEYTPELEEA